MLKVSPLLLSALLFGAPLLHPSDGCPYLAQLQQKGRAATEDPQQPMVRKLEADESIEDTSTSSTLNHHVDRRLQIGNIFLGLWQFILSIFGIGNDPRANQDDGNDGLPPGGNGGGNNDFNPTPFQGTVQEALEASRLDIINIMDAPKFVRLAFHDCVGGVCDGEHRMLMLIESISEYKLLYSMFLLSFFCQVASIPVFPTTLVWTNPLTTYSLLLPSTRRSLRVRTSGFGLEWSLPRLLRMVAMVAEDEDQMEEAVEEATTTVHHPMVLFCHSKCSLSVAPHATILKEDQLVTCPPHISTRRSFLSFLAPTLDLRILD